MTKGRKPNPPAEPPVDVKFNEVALAKRSDDVRTMALVDEGLVEGAALGKLAGRLETFLFLKCISEAGVLAAYEDARGKGSWRRFKGRNGFAFESFDDFCREALGLTERRLQQITVNRNLLGRELFEQAENLGLRQLDYNAIKALPAPEQELVRRAVQDTQSREEVVSLIQELASRSAQRELAQNQTLENERKERTAVEKRLAATVKMRDRAENESARIQALEPDEALAELRIEATRKTALVLGSVQGHLRQALIALSHEEQDQSMFMALQIGEVVRELAKLRDEFHLVDLSNAEDLARAAEVEQWAGGSPKKGR